MDNFFDDWEEQKQLSPKVRNSRFYRKIKTDIKMETSRLKNDGSKVAIRLNQKEYYTPEDVADFNLEQYSKLIPEHDGYKVITSTYFIRFWGPVFDYKPKVKGKIVRRSGGIIAYTYLVLKSYCWGKDYCWISLQTLADNLTVSKNAARGYLEELESEGFIIRFWREADKEGATEDESILIKVRQTIPFLTKEKLDLLPKSLRDEHDEFLKRIRLESEKEFEDAYNYTEVYEKLRNKSVEVKKPQAPVDPYDKVAKKVTERDAAQWNLMLERMKSHIQESSIHHWFDDSLAIFKDGNLSIYVKSEFHKEHIEKRYIQTIKIIMDELLIPSHEVEIISYES